MANPSSRTNHWNKAVHVLELLSLLLLIQRGAAYEFKVGGSGDWSVPADPNASYNAWAQRSRFKIGDTVLFTYPADKDWVLQVSKDDYDNCRTKEPLVKFTGGHTVYKINQSGPHYFISGVEEHCKNNEKVVIVVMADRRNRSSSPSNSPPSPAPSGEESPSPPSSGSADTNPSPAPSEEADHPPPPPHPSGASSIFMSSICSITGFVGAMLLVIS